MKNYQIAKTILYLTAGILVLIFNQTVINFVGLTVASVVIVFGVDITVFSIIKKSYFGENSLFFGGIIQFTLGLIILLVKDDIIKVCLTWAIWSILREIKEMSNAINEIRERKYRFINLTESILIIIFSFIMIMNPDEPHARIHVYILGVELLLEVIFPYLNGIIDSRVEKKRKTRLDLTAILFF